MKKRRFKHLSWNDRLRIESFLKCGKKVQEIADEIGVHRNTIYNELKRGRYIHRNSDWTEEERYSPDIAEAAYRENLAAKGPGLKIGKDPPPGRIHRTPDRRRRIFPGGRPGRNQGQGNSVRHDDL